MTRALRAVIVDDEPLARARLSRLLGREHSVEVLAEFGDGESAAQGLRALAPDVVFVDVRMPQLDGFAMLERLAPSQRPLVVFVTAYSEHAVQAFDARAVDYLVKPVAPDRLHDSVQRVRHRLAAREGADRASSDAAAPYPERLAVPDGLRVRIVAVRDIEYLLAQGNYVELRVDGRSLLLRETMAGIQSRLDPRLFVRIHRSRIVRIDLIEQIEAHGAGQYLVRMRSGARMTSGRSYRAELRKALGLTAADETPAMP
ncbi:LytTR family DNA-binding domain-containing protein [Luteimonas sp. SX5]|uniref:LytTR family DNA-binding domain-containing protein n=1 Tax=Luteimonas galliterrae TaxID=2940486 RepID=A0ABT0ME16_9GAMM|nr:LytTR family DNA-binding domain-containing protein [Luteimonas galliterrae]MCL1633114.1 LytTR family DNA-binding domain-containing protein [Luteimonas galliterrae]